MKQVIFSFWLAVACIWGSLCAGSYEWLPGASYASEVPPPESVLGYEIGTYLTDHLQMLDYMGRLEETSDRIRIVEYGRSVEGRRMILVIIASPQNLARLEEIRLAAERLTDPRTLSREEAERLCAETPPIGWMNFANDGGETAAFEAGMQLAYQLAAGEDSLTQEIVQNVVTIINPAANPDSHQTFTTWMKAATIGPRGTADPNASEHHVPWFISSDGNHYLIDSNRDAFALTQIETRAIAEMLHHWNPQVWIDNHGEPNEYYFAPFTAPMNLNYPQSLRRWATTIGENSARHFDRFGWTYVKDETYDLFYPGYWDSYPALNGAVAATYETNGGGWKNLSWEKPDGTLSTLRGAVHGHFIADLATLEVLAAHGAGILRDFHNFFREGMEEAEGEDYQSYVLLPSPDPGRTLELVDLLRRHGIEVFQSERALSVRARDYFDEALQEREIPSGSFIVPLKQPLKRMVKTFFEPEPALEESFLIQMREARERNQRLGKGTPKEPLGFYDVTAWALPLLFGTDCLLTPEAVSLDEASLLSRTPEPAGASGRAGYAYLFANDTDAGTRLAGNLLQKGFRVAIATRPFRNSGRDYPAGTFIVRTGRNPEELHATISSLADEVGASVFSTGTAWSETGLSLGSKRIVDLEAPRIAVFSDEPTQAVTFGASYALLEQRFGLEFTAIRADYFNEVELGRYNVIIAPDGSADGYRRLLGDEGLDRLKAWIREGGVLIAIKGAAEMTTQGGVEWSDVESVGAAPADPAEEEGGRRSFEYLPGAIFAADLNGDYFLGYGMPERIAVQVRGNRFMSPSQEGTNVVTFPDDAHIQGFQWETTEEDLAGKTYLSDIRMGKGHLILFADDPTFRAHWRGLDRLVLNAVLLGPSF